MRAGALLLLIATAANATTLLKYELQLDAVARGNGAFSRRRLIPQDNRYDDDWMTIDWERARLHFEIENRGGAPLQIDWNGASVQVDGEPALRVIHGGVGMKDRRLPQTASVIHPWSVQCDGVIPAQNVYWDPRQKYAPANGFDPLFGGGGWGWGAKPLIPIVVTGDARAAIASLAQRVIVITLPFSRRGVTRRYRFRLVPSNVMTNEETTLAVPHDPPSVPEPADSDDDMFWSEDNEPSSDWNCDPHRGEDQRLVEAMFPQELRGVDSRSSWARAAFDRAPRRDYLVAYYANWEIPEKSVLRVVDVRAKPRVVGETEIRPSHMDGVRLQDVNHDGWPEITLNDHGSRASFFALWRWTGTTFRSMEAPHDKRHPFDFVGELEDVDHDGVDEIVEMPESEPSTKWPEYPWTIYRLNGSHYELWRKPDYFFTLATWLRENFFAAHSIAAPRVMTIENLDYDDSPAPDATVELNGRAIARPRDFASKPRLLRFPVRLEDWNIICASGRDPVRLTITIEPAEK